MKRFVVAISVALLFTPILEAQESTPAPPPVEQQIPGQQPGASSSTPPGQAIVPVAVPIAPPRSNGPVQKSLVRITATRVEREYRAPWHAGALDCGVGAGLAISGTRNMTK